MTPVYHRLFFDLRMPCATHADRDRQHNIRRCRSTAAWAAERGRKSLWWRADTHFRGDREKLSSVFLRFFRKPAEIFSSSASALPPTWSMPSTGVCSVGPSSPCFRPRGSGPPGGALGAAAAVVHDRVLPLVHGSATRWTQRYSRCP